LNEAIELVTYQEHNYRATVGEDYTRKERTGRVAHTDEPDLEALLEEDSEVLGAQRKSNAYLSVHGTIDNSLKQIECNPRKKAKLDKIFKELDTLVVHLDRLGISKVSRNSQVKQFE
jgi:hypothetical protein